MPVNIDPASNTGPLSGFLNKINPIITVLEQQDEAVSDLADEVATQTQNTGPNLVLLFENGLI